MGERNRPGEDEDDGGEDREVAAGHGRILRPQQA
jgi:hypothetical protein